MLGTQYFYNCNTEALSHLQFLPYGVWHESKAMRFYAPKDPAHVSHSLVNLQGTQDYFDAECRAIKDLMLELKHSQISLLKLDVEGAEYKIIDSLLFDGILPSILCIEFDEGHTP
jgi:FkbM family methyltransferase